MLFTCDAKGKENPLSFISAYNLAIFLIFMLCYTYQVYYVYVALRYKPQQYVAHDQHRFAAISCGRNEAAVIGQLVKSLKCQDYPSELLDVFVVADNCTDNTAVIAEQAGAIVFRRNNKVEVGKSYALDYAFKRIMDEYADKGYEGFFVFDSDNLADSHFVSAMNAAYDNGEQILTSYRNTKNFGSSWISSSYSLWFLRESRYISGARSALDTSCLIGGTGFMVSARIIEENGGWPYHTLTEDIEFSSSSVVKGYKIGFCNDAVFYDEQPTTLSASWTQRLRWAKGFYQVALRYCSALLKGVLGGVKTTQVSEGEGDGIRLSTERRRRFACYDVFMTVAPSILLTLATLVVNTGYLVVGALGGMSVGPVETHTAVEALLMCGVTSYLSLFGMAALAAYTEHERVDATPRQLLRATLLFPFFMLTYVPISVQALFTTPQWKPVKHVIVASIDEFAALPAAEKVVTK